MTYAVQLIINGLVGGGIYALMALAITQLYKSTGVFNFAQGQFMVFGAYTFWVMLVSSKLPLWLSVIIGIMAGAALGFIVDRVFMRKLIGQPFFALVMVTLGLSLGLRGALAALGAGSQRNLPAFLPDGVLRGGGVTISVQFLIIFIVTIAFSIAFLIFFQRSKLGLLMRATAEDHEIAQSVGINVGRIFTYSWMVSGFVATIAGILLGVLYGINVNLMDVLGMKALPVVLLGGLESIPGAVIGGLLIGVIEITAAGYLDPLVGGGIQEVVPFVVLVLILLVRPSGLFGQKRIERV